MHIGAHQLVDEISTSKEMEKWVLNIEARVDNQVIANPTEPLQTNINNVEKPSIYFHSPELFDFRRIYSFSDTTAWKFVAFMRRWFGLNVRSYLEYIQEKEDLFWGYYYVRENYREKYRAEKRKEVLEYILLSSCVLVFEILSLQNVCNAIGIMSGTKEKWSDPRDQRSTEFYTLYETIEFYPTGFKLDMLTLEKQIPWFVVEAIYTNHSNLSNLVGTPIDILAISCFDDLYPGVHKSKVHGGTRTLPPSGFKHLLHIFHWSRSPQGKYLVETRSLQPIEKMKNFYIPSATELQLSETVFEKHAGGSIDVSYCYRRLSAVMQLAPWHIFDYSDHIYLNLIKFEGHYMGCGFPFTAYVACMVCLLHTEADVRLLRAKGIIPSTRNDEKDVLHFVQEKFKHLILDSVPMSNDLYDLSNKVRAHHERSSSRYYAELKSHYCANPWITISIIAGICLFVLTFVQTIYGMLSYYKQ